jgi:hypothetical protein
MSILMSYYKVILERKHFLKGLFKMKKIFSLAIFTLAISTSGFASNAQQTPVEALETLVQDYNTAKPAYEELFKSEKVGLGFYINNMKKPGLDDAFLDQNSFVHHIDADYLNKTMRLNKLAYDISMNADLDVATMAQAKIDRRQKALAQIKAAHKNATTSKGWVYNSDRSMSPADRASIKNSIVELFDSPNASKDLKDVIIKLKNDQLPMMDFQDSLGKFEQIVKNETKSSFIDREIQNDYNEAIKKDQNLIAWNHDFKGYEIVDSFLRNGVEFGGFILYNKNINDMIVVVPGTKSLKDWFKNVQVWGKKGNASTGAGVGLNIHKGFAIAYEQSIGSIKAAFNTFLEKNMDNIKSTKNPFTCHVTGHSLGAAIATILAYDFKTNLLPAKKIDADIKLVTVASPRLLDEKSGKKLEEKLGRANMLRIFNVWDAVPTIVPEIYNSKHVGVEFPLYDSLLDEAYMGPMVVNHFMDRYTNIIEEGFNLLKKNLAERIRLEKAISNFDKNYASTYESFKNYVNANATQVKHMNQIKEEVSDSDSDSDSDSYDKIRKERRSSAKAKKIEAAKIAKKDLAKAKELKADADRLEQEAMMASIMFGHAQLAEANKSDVEEKELAKFLAELGLDDEVGEEQPMPDAIEAY